MAETNAVQFSDKDVINIVLFGEAGVGKSTFVNAFANYMKYNNLEEASNGKLLCPIPMKFKLVNNAFVEQVVQIGQSDENESPGEGVSSTQNPKSYILKVPEKNMNIRIIDTPGIGDTRGLEYDAKNAEKLLTLLGELHHVNAFCVLVKPNQSRITVFFDYCIKYLLSKLDKKVYENFVFIVTNARASFFTPGDTYLPLKSLLDKISTDTNKILFDKTNIFCVDNESIRYLAAKSHGIQFTENDALEYAESWRRSSDAVHGMIEYVKNLTPASMLGTLSINDSRRIALKLCGPIIEVMEKCEEAKELILQHEKNLLQNQDSLTQLRSLLTVPVTRYEIKEDVVNTKTPDRKQYSGFKFRWTPPFIYYNFGVERSITQTVVTTTTYTPYVSYEEAANIKPLVLEKEELKTKMNHVIKELKSSIKEYETEEQVLLDAIVHFRVFLRENTFVADYDMFKSDLVNLINKEKNIDQNSTRVENYEGLLSTYLERINEVHRVKPEKIIDIKDTLLKQKHFGVFLTYFYERQIEATDTALSL